MCAVPFLLLAAGCSEDPDEEIQALGEEYELYVQTALEPQQVAGDIDELDRESAESLFEYISSSLEESSPYGDSDVPVESELREPAEPHSSGGTHLAPNAEYADEDDEFPAFSRNVSFDYQLQEDTDTITPETIYIQDMEAELTGTISGAEWQDHHVTADFDNEAGELIFFTEGVWNIHFLYEGEEVFAEITDNWFVHFDPEEILEFLPETS